MKVLFLSRWFPYPPSNGSKLRIYNLLRGLAQYHEVTLLSFADQPNIDRDNSELNSLCREVQVVPWKPFNPNGYRAQLGFLSLKPRSVIDTFSAEMKELIEQKFSEQDYNLVVASEIDMAVYSQFFGRTPAILDELQVGVLYERFIKSTSLPHRLRFGLTWIKLCHYLNTTLKNFQVSVVASAQERQLLDKAAPNYPSVEIIPNCVNIDNYRGVDEAPQPNTLIFTGAFSFLPNYQAMLWFLNEAYPHIQSRVPDIHLSITGDHANRPLPSANNVTLTGFVNDIRPLIARSWVSIVPLHVGGGTRLKILEAMALRTPVVATSKGAEGLDVQTGKHLLIADTPEDFAQAVLRLLKEPGLRQQLADNAYQLVCQKYSWEVVIPRFLDLVERVANT